MLSPKFKPAEKFPVKCYKLRNILYVPHYRYNGYAYPGIRKHDEPVSEYQLVNSGATECTEFLYNAYARIEKK